MTGSIALAVSTRKILHHWDERENTYGCNVVHFIPGYTPQFRTAIVEDTTVNVFLQMPTKHEIARLTDEGYRFCIHCFGQEPLR